MGGIGLREGREFEGPVEPGWAAWAVEQATAARELETVEVINGKIWPLSKIQIYLAA